MNKHEVDLQQFLMCTPRTAWGTLPPIVCEDGFTMSVQVGESVYSTPRSSRGPWTSVEIGYPSRVEPIIWEYAETPGAWTETVYPYTPVRVVAAVIEVHGGLSVSLSTRSPEDV